MVCILFNFCEGKVFLKIKMSIWKFRNVKLDCMEYRNQRLRFKCRINKQETEMCSKESSRH